LALWPGLTTIEAAELLNESGFPIPREAVIQGLRDVDWPGRLELIDDRPALLLDGAHNPAGARTLRAYLDEFWQVPITLVFGAMNDKDIDRIASELFDVARTVVLTRIKDRRAADNARLGASALRSSRNVIFAETVRQALSWARSVTPPDRSQISQPPPSQAAHTRCLGSSSSITAPCLSQARGTLMRWMASNSATSSIECV